MENARKLRKDAATQKHLFLESTAGMELSKKKKYQTLEAKAKNAIERRQDENSIASFRGMASSSIAN